MRIVSAVLGAGIIFISYKILKELKLNTKWSILTLILLFLFISDSFYLDYNYVILFITLLIIFLETKYKNYSKKYNFLIGILAGSTILFKQSTGVIICAITALYLALEDRNKEVLKAIIYRVIGIIVPGIIFTIYLICTNSLMDFIDYCVLGIGTFTNNVSYMKLLQGKDLEAFLGVVTPITFLILFIEIIINIKNKKIKENKNK